MTSFGESPAASQVLGQWRDRIVHATLTLERPELAGADTSPDEFSKAGAFTCYLSQKIR